MKPTRLAFAATVLALSFAPACSLPARAANPTSAPAANPTSAPAANPTSAPAANPTSAAAARAAASPAGPELEAFRKAIRAKYALKEKAFADHDAETIVTKFYSPDVISVGEGEGIFVGRDQIRPLYEEVVKDNTVRIDSVYTFVSGNAGWDWADFHVTPAKGAPFTFAILFLWAKVDGQWMCKGDFFVNGSFRTGKLAPPPAQ